MTSRSALIASQSGEHAGRRLRSGRTRQRLGEVVELFLSWHEVTRRPQTRERIIGDRDQDRYRATAVGDLDALATLDSAQQLASPLPKLPYTNARHVLFVAQFEDVSRSARLRFARVGEQILDRQRMVAEDLKPHLLELLVGQIASRPG
jgi:hypothetical protein